MQIQFPEEDDGIPSKSNLHHPWRGKESTTTHTQQQGVNTFSGDVYKQYFVSYNFVVQGE